MNKAEYEYIRKVYKVPARKGAKITFQGKEATIQGVTPGGAYLKIKVKGVNGVKVIHPTWEVVYLESESAEEGGK